MVEEFGILGREQLTCGCHVHVEVGSDEEGVAVLDRIRPWLAVLLALSANSPFWQDHDTGFASYRHELWGRWPSAGPTEIFGSAARYRDVVAALVATPALLDRKMVYFDARLSDRYPTVEIRVADVCLQVEDAALLAALGRALVDTAAAAWRRGEAPDPVRTELLRAASWTASRSGLDDRLLHPADRRPVPAARAVDALLEHTRAALAAAGDLDFARAGLAALAERGTGARRQRAWQAAGLDRAEVVLAAVEMTVGDSGQDPH
jgi:carboxylate-amine ligase